MRFLNSSENPNTTVGLFLLIVLAVFAGSNALPSVLSSLLPFADEGTSCLWLYQTDDRGDHQSLIGRSSSTIPDESPLSVRVDPDPVPSDPAQDWVIRIILTNETIGSIPIFVNPTPNINVAQTGFGVIFNSATAVPLTGGPPNPNNVHILAPRQRCVYRVTIPAGTFGNLGITPASQVKAYYINTSAIGVTQANSVYPDLGLWVGVIESPSATLTLSVGTSN